MEDTILNAITEYSANRIIIPEWITFESSSVSIGRHPYSFIEFYIDKLFVGRMLI